MPGMMDTVLNLGLNDETVRGLVKASGDERFASDSYRCGFSRPVGDAVLRVLAGLLAAAAQRCGDLAVRYGVAEQSASRHRSGGLYVAALDR
jgi:hypothetical protein